MATSTSPLARQPDKLDYLSPTQFKFNIHQLPKVEFFTTAANVPDLTLADAIIPTPFKPIPVMGTNLTFSNLSVTFIVDEFLENYRELHDWINGIGFPESFDQRKEELQKSAGIKASKDLLSDGTLVILNSNMNPNLEVTFKDLYPVSLGDVQFDLSQTDVEYITATADFRFRSFDVNII